MECYICGRNDTECKIKKVRGMFLCPRHVTQMYRYGAFDDNTIYQKNEIILYDDHAEIILKDKNCNESGRAIIDIDDVDKCSEYKWHIRKRHGKTDYVIASLPDNHKIHLHRFVMNYDGDLDIDHINHNGLDNRKSNLRIVTHAQNTANSRGVGIKKVHSGRYKSVISRNYKTIYLGTYDTFDEAAIARKRFIETYG